MPVGEPMNQRELIPHLFRKEFARITAVLCKSLGIREIDSAEDIASEVFVSALETWTYKGIPENPTGWLYLAAKNKARNFVKHNRIFKEKIVKEIEDASEHAVDTPIDLSEENIRDSQLQMLFAVCHPSISLEAQIALALRILCGFGIDEIANAFLTNKETINKRLHRAKEKLRTEKVAIEFPSEDEITNRLDTVLTTIYLLFNEGYYSESSESILREDFCLEAMRLAYLLTENPRTNRPKVNALLALMCFHSSRLPARKTKDGAMTLYEDQDETLWNRELINKGAYFLREASIGNTLSKYHLEAAIAYWHTHKADSREKWESILQLHNQLLVIEYSPVAALNRTYALSKVKGKKEAIAEAEKLNLTENHFYFTLLGELYREIDDNKAKEHFQRAFELAGTDSEKRSIQKRIQALS